MPSGQTKFQTSWLEAEDCSGRKVGLWCRKGTSDHTAFCTVCLKQIACDNNGLEQVFQHARGKKHRDLMDGMKSQPTLVQKLPTSAALPAMGSSLQLYVHADEVLKAEVLWCFQVCRNGFTFRSCDGITETFQAMFNGDVIAKDMKLSRSKVSYVIADGLGPHFLKELVNDINESKTPFVVEYDETTQAQIKKQLNIQIRYWSKMRNEVCVRFYKALMFGHAEGATVAGRMMETLQEDGVKLQNLSCLSSDGPNVNKTIWMHVQKELTDAGHNGLIQIGSCNIHVVHNAFRAALCEFGKDAEELAIDLHTFFKLSAARREDFSAVQLDLELKEEFFVRHVTCRWLTFGRAVKRILRQWPAICQYIAMLQKKDVKQQPVSGAYRRIARQCQSKELLAQMHFIDEVVPVFEDFTAFFQSEEPQIHVLYTKMARLLQQLLLRFVNPHLLNNIPAKQYGTIDFKNVVNQLSDTDIVLGETVRKALKAVAKEKHRGLIMSMRQFYSTAATYLATRLPLQNELLCNLTYLEPKQSLSVESTKAVEDIAKKLPNIADTDVGAIVDEWKLYQVERSAVALSEGTPDADDKSVRIDHYWRNVMSQMGPNNACKFPKLSLLIKSALVLPHGNADVERSFSVNGNVLTDSRTEMSPETLNGLLLVKDTLKFYDPVQSLPSSIPLTKDLLRSCRLAYSAYQARLEKEKEQVRQAEAEKTANEEKARKAKQAQEAQQAKNTARKEKAHQLSKDEAIAKDKLTVGKSILQEGNVKLASAISSKDFKQAAVAQAMLEQGEKKIHEAMNSLHKISGERKRLLSQLTSADDPAKAECSQKKKKE